MARAAPEVDRLIEEGLARYGLGDLDGALMSWEEALELAPEHERALGYIDYVRMNYELLVSEVSGHGEPPPFPLADDEPEYQIEITRGELAPAPQAAPPKPANALDGWSIAEERGFAPPAQREVLFEMEADEPPGEGDDPPQEELELVTGPDGVNFEDATSEYPGGVRRASRTTKTDEASSTEFRLEITPTPGFDVEPEVTPGFSTQVTDIRRRELGFVQPVGSGDGPHRRASSSAPELKMTLRTPDGGTRPHSQALPIAHGPSLPIRPVPEPPSDPGLDLAYDHDPPTLERSPVDERGRPTTRPGTRAASQMSGPTRDLPGPTRPPGPTPPPELPLTPIGTPRDVPSVSSRPTTTTNPPPPPAQAPSRPGTVTPAPPVSPATMTVDLTGRTDTRDIPTERKESRRAPTPGPGTVTPAAGQPPGEPRPPRALTPTKVPFTPEFLEPTTTRMQKPSERMRPPPTSPALRPAPMLPLPTPDPNPLVSAPTRDLGLRQQPITPASQPPPPRRAAIGSGDDDPTGREDLRAVQRAATAQGGPASPPSAPATDSDAAAAFDPIDARGAEILGAIDEGAPAGELREDRTRRRITTLFERAAQWSKAGELDRAVAAIELALSEDPNSALAQKLIHRNRDTMMAVFQNFLGDLQRTPILARPLHELAAAPISPRAAFLLSRVDGLLSIDEILDVSGMPRLEAYRHLCQLFLRGILR